MWTVHGARRPRRWFAVGPGTVVALAAALAILGWGWLGTHETPTVGAGRIAYESDGNGSMRRVDPPTPDRPGAMPPPLWKPEPAFLTAHARDLALTPNQERRAAALSAGWESEKAVLSQDLRRSSQAVRALGAGDASGRRVPLALLQQGLGEYSQDSRQYDARRAHYWAQAMGLLSPTQRRQAERLGAGGDGAR